MRWAYVCVQGTLGGGRLLGRRESFEEDETDWLARESSSHAGESPSLVCFFFPAAGRPLLLRSGPGSVAVAGALLLLPAQGREEKRRLLNVCLSGTGWVPEPLSSPSQGCPGLHQYLQHAPDVLPDARTSTVMAHQPCGLCEKWHYARLPSPKHPLVLPRTKADHPKFFNPCNLQHTDLIHTLGKRRGWGVSLPCLSVCLEVFWGGSEDGTQNLTNIRRVPYR